MSETIKDFLLARIAEDEREANGHLGAEYYQDGLWPEDVAKRVLRECAAKRAIVGTYAAVEANRNTEGSVQWHEERALLTSVRALATVYSDHPDYQEEWAV